jgi:hypothetical protein
MMRAFLCVISLLTFAVRGALAEVKHVGETCADDNPCAQGLDFAPAPVQRKRFPVTGAVSDDCRAYGGNMMELAGVTFGNPAFRPLFPISNM